MSMDDQLIDSWQKKLGGQFALPYMTSLQEFLASERKAGKQIYPPENLVFNALNSTPFERVSVVILGQDPYHGSGQAHGLSFSVQPGVAIPPSLVNIYKELYSDVGAVPPMHGCLTSWAEQGVLLLNAVLTVEQGNAGAHQGKGWEQFTDEVIRALNDQRENIVFILWGNYAQKKGAFIDQSKHCVLTSAHPSPLSAHRGFLGSKPFSQCNAYLKSKGLPEVNWSLPLQL
ncbi:uracil-DNA glycosylase [Oleiphilus sp. HI0071]|nr:uracil-DNA glycosylase [Oleiphilus sp. HI0080]KZY62200.1 uracil-DNA glycosylase [Oleiphilus sp. HI0065]KZY82136.1 uracil-DNA glycosylase [Oleiphilus sp. HI0071]KZZ00824.1 uracil-DNA glycosylase [Oleiphilus sp. HI0073]KZZ48245.1 uracil-DNA glycosylase [Oleiphilus sp. HI0122]KZZ48448.1 uracil-DNA glycosylase [Oleiphilus sp. HI0118]KZZ79276.1 uracil-DNA glycosylase [Oleiphilus sp. HI0133]